MRFDGNRLALLSQPSLPDLHRVTAEDRAHASIDGPLALQPFGVERRRPVP